ncbi:hypothetical protein C8J56DRAFT_896916 [Mycena floridula]|nr:hypothetical protein C8J56DRAFT_896916 [Mycena floridula]
MSLYLSKISDAQQHRAAQFHANRASSHANNISDSKNTIPEPVIISRTSVNPRKKTLKEQVLEKDAGIAGLQDQVSSLQELMQQLQQTVSNHYTSINSLESRNNTLLSRNQLLKDELSLKRKAEQELSQTLVKRHKQIQRLEKDREYTETKEMARMDYMDDILDRKDARMEQMEKDLASLHLQATASEDTIISLKFQLKERQSLLTTTQK